MVARYVPTDAELYLYAILTDPSGVDLAEFCFVNEEEPDKVFRCWDFQWPWYHDTAKRQIEQASRTLGKTEGIAMRACTHPFRFPGQERMITGPEGGHVDPITTKIEARIRDIWFLREMCPKGAHMGVRRQPAWQISFRNNAVIRSRLPQRTGLGMKGQHPVVIELDEAQDFPELGYKEIIECLKENEEAEFRLHGVPKGGRETFYRWTSSHDPDMPFKVHRLMAMSRPSWNAKVRKAKIAQYGGSRLDPDYLRNIYGEHGDATSPLFVLARLMQCVDEQPDSEYNTEIYSRIDVTDERIRHFRGREVDPGDPRSDDFDWIDALVGNEISGTHLQGYAGYYGGGDLGMTNHPSEFLVAGEIDKRGTKKGVLRLLLRLHLERVAGPDQEALLRWLRTYYIGLRFGGDRAGVGREVVQRVVDCRIVDGVIKTNGPTATMIGWDFSEKVVIALDETVGDELEDQLVYRYLLDYSSEELRGWVDRKSLELPNDTDLINQMQGQTWKPRPGTDIDPNRPKRTYSKGNFHALDGLKYLIATRTLPELHARIELARKQVRGPVYAVFPGALVGGP